MPRLAGNYLPVSLRDPLERALFMLTAAGIAATLVSIAASQAFLFSALLCGSWLLLRNRSKPPALEQLGWPLLAFFIWTILASFASANVLLDLTITRKFLIFLVLFLAPAILQRQGGIRWMYHAIFVAAGASSLAGVAQYLSNPDRDLLNRISGFMSLWMTYSGLQMLVLVSLFAYGMLYGWRRNWWAPPLALALGLSLYLSLTRNAWLGAAAGVLTVLALRRPRAIMAFALLLSLLGIFGPAVIQERLRSAFDREDTTTQGRIELMETSLRLIRENPWFGVGPKSVNTEALRYRGNHEFPDWLYQHMHNNFLQIAAERGIPGLILWLWLMIRLAWDAFKTLRASKGDAGGESNLESSFAATAALGSWAALMASGLFEYNFGDSEVLTLFLFIMSAPYASHPPQP